MKHVEIDLGGQKFYARLLEDRAPKTCQAIWDALPFGGHAVHAQLSGDMFRMLDTAPVKVEDDEGDQDVAFQYPGLVVYYPPISEIAFCYGRARFRGLAHAEYVIPIAEIEGDIKPFARAGAQLQWDGETPIHFRRAEGPVQVAPPPEPKGRKIEVRLGDAVVTATLLEDEAPRTVEAFVKLLPLEGKATNTKWSGAMTRFWTSNEGGRGSIGLNIDPPEAPTQFHWPGYIYYHISWDGIRICYGDANMSGPFSVSEMTPLARFDGDWSAFQKTAANLFRTGAKDLSFRLL